MTLRQYQALISLSNAGLIEFSIVLFVFKAEKLLVFYEAIDQYIVREM